MALTSTRVAVEFFRIQSVGGASLSSVIARPTTNRITSVAEHGFVDLPDKVEAVPQVSTGYGVLLLDATDQAGVSESFGWQIGLVGEYGSLTLAVPSAPVGGRTVTVGGTSYPAVWLTDLADFSVADGSLPLSSFFTKSEVDARFAALPFRSDNTTLTGAAPGSVYALGKTAGGFDLAELPGDIVLSPSGDATGATDLANLTAAATAAVAAGVRLVLPAGSFYINAPWVLPQRLSCQGAPMSEHWVSNAAGMMNQNRPGTAATVLEPLAGYPFDGTLIVQVTPGANVIEGTAASSTHDLRNLTVTWATLNTNTGHGFVFDTATLYLGLPDLGSFGSYYEKLTVWGNDGNHYGFSWTNPLYCTSQHLRVYGGGGYRHRGESARVASGNCVHTHPYVYILNQGTANGIQNERMGANEAGAITHMVWVRPQVNCGSGSTTQLGWNDAGGPYWPTSSVAFGLDLEDAGGNVFAPDTDAFGGVYVNSSKAGPFGRYHQAYANVRLGKGALGAATSSDGNAAVGVRALAALTTGNHATAVGFEAGRDTTAVGNTFVGYIAGQVDTTGAGLTAIGHRALAKNVTNSNSTAVGYDALTNATASSNTALGFSSGSALTTGGSNVLMGSQTVASGTTATSNVAVGHQAGYATTPTAVTANATVAGQRNTFVGNHSGAGSNADPSRTVALGYGATVIGQNAIAIGYAASAGASGAVAIGVDSANTSSAATTQDDFVLGTALHKVKVAGRLNVAPRTPSSSADAQGAVGDITTDDSYVYVKTTAGWKRSALTTF